jgi:hypothetical protein
VYTAITDRVLLAFAPAQRVSTPVSPVVDVGPVADVLPFGGSAHGPCVFAEIVAQFDGLSVPNTTYICAGAPSLIPASGSSPVRSDTGKSAPGKCGSGDSDGLAYGLGTAVVWVRNVSTGHCWSGGGFNPS